MLLTTHLCIGKFAGGMRKAANQPQSNNARIGWRGVRGVRTSGEANADATPSRSPSQALDDRGHMQRSRIQGGNTFDRRVG